MSVQPCLSESDVDQFQTDFAHLQEALNGVLVGQSELVTELLTGLLAGGHVLLEGLPGLGKTHLVKGLANAMGIALARIQCTPDLMPADITGCEVMVGNASDRGQHFEFRSGPIFSPMVLVDEINRATPKTQAALLEAMQERQVTYAGTSHPLPDPFWVIATQNPIEFEGTYPLPEAQLDRFLYKLKVSYPTREAMLQMLERSLDNEPSDTVVEVVSTEHILQMMTLPQRVLVAPVVKQSAVDLVMATHPDQMYGNPLAEQHFSYGASPRALQALLRSSRIRALAQGRGHVSREDLRACALPALRHRVLLRIESELNSVSADDILEEIAEAWTRA